MTGIFGTFMPAFIVIAPEKIAKARHLYETTSVSVHDIAAFLGIGTTTFMKRVKQWGWRPRNRRLAELDAAARANVPVEEIREAAAAPMAVIEHASLVARVRSAVEREIVAIENVLSRVESVQLRSADAERAARALATLVKTLREVSTLEDSAGAAEEEREDQFRDLEEFRRELVDRLERIRRAAEPE
jgi:hypothetical protein